MKIKKNKKQTENTSNTPILISEHTFEELKDLYNSDDLSKEQLEEQIHEIVYNSLSAYVEQAGQILDEETDWRLDNKIIDAIDSMGTQLTWIIEQYLIEELCFK